MFCRQCGAQINENQAFCGKCGTEIQKQSTISAMPETPTEKELVDPGRETATAKKTSTRLKIVIPIVVLLLVAGIIGLIVWLCSDSSDDGGADTNWPFSQAELDTATPLTDDMIVGKWIGRGLYGSDVWHSDEAQYKEVYCDYGYIFHADGSLEMVVENIDVLKILVNLAQAEGKTAEEYCRAKGTSLQEELSELETLHASSIAMRLVRYESRLSWEISDKKVSLLDRTDEIATGILVGEQLITVDSYGRKELSKRFD
ncbi:MAG: zinc ribbon domain-containing protein [Clostridia bacterium]|nr:zinc ribbon domain-containing protein [Clostridia bacterium]